MKSFIDSLHVKWVITCLHSRNGKAKVSMYRLEKLISSEACTKVFFKSSWRVCSFHQYVSLVTQKKTANSRFCSPSVRLDMPQDRTVCSSNWETHRHSAQLLSLKRRTWDERDNKLRLVYWRRHKDGWSLLWENRSLPTANHRSESFITNINHKSFHVCKMERGLLGWEAQSSLVSAGVKVRSPICACVQCCAGSKTWQLPRGDCV